MDPNIDHTHDDDDDELIQDEDAVYKKRKCHSDFARKDLLHRLFCDATSAKDAGDITLKFDGFEIGAHESVMSVGTTFFKRGWAQRRGGGSANGSNNTRATMDMTEVLVDMHTVGGITKGAVCFFLRYMYNVVERGEAEERPFQDIITVIGLADVLKVGLDIKAIIISDVTDVLSAAEDGEGDNDGEWKLGLAKALMACPVVSTALPGDPTGGLLGDTWEPVKIIAAKYIITEIRKKLSHDISPSILLSILHAVCTADK